RVVGRSDRFNRNMELEPCQKFGQAWYLLPKRFPLLVLTIEFRTPAVFFGDLEMIENPAMIQKLWNQSGIFGQLQGQNCGTIGFNVSAFNRVIIQKDEAIKPKPQLRGQGFEV